MAARSPRRTAAMTYWSARDDLPAPEGPISIVVVPRLSPPPSRASISWSPLETSSGVNSLLCSSAISDGNTSTAPVLMTKSCQPL